MMFKMFFVRVLPLIMIISDHATTASNVNLINNQYSGILIAINNGVTEDLNLLDRIKHVFTEASQTLYWSTRKRAYFGEITILAPDNWTSITADDITTEDYNNADVIIRNPDSELIPLGIHNRPFVIKSTPCGEQGELIHLTPDYITQDQASQLYGPYGKTLVHEWAHYRWGVFDEYPTEGDPKFYATDGGKYEATRCSRKSPGYEYNPTTDKSCAYVNGEPEPDCIWKDLETDVVGRMGSLMYNHSLYHILEFCDDNTDNDYTLHNAEAPTQQNIKCDGKSVWQVMKEHADFLNNGNPPRKVASTEPTFRIVRRSIERQTRRTVLVLDKSGSMSGFKIEILRQGCNDYIENRIRDGDELGIVDFSSSATVNTPLLEVSSATRPTLLQGILPFDRGTTAIGQGIQAALQLLAGNTGKKGGEIVIVSDGVENVQPYVALVLNDIKSAQVIAHSIAVSNAAAPSIDQAAQETGGLSFFVSTAGGTIGTGINDAFEQIAGTNNQNIPLTSTSQPLPAGDRLFSSVNIDSSVTQNTKFVISYSGTPIQFIITSPNGTSYTTASPQTKCDDTFKVCTLEIKGKAEVGSWTYEVTSPSSSQDRVAVSVSAAPNSDGSEPITAVTSWALRELDLTYPDVKQRIITTVSKGFIPILNVEVLAKIDGPNGPQASLILRDNGIGADATKEDGIYSAYFLDFLTDGRYSVQVVVNSSPETKINPGKMLGLSVSNSNESIANASLAVDQFQRQSVGGAFQLKNYNGQTYSPSRISDLKVIQIDYSKPKVTLQWTAVGAQLDQGTASRYELRYSTNFSHIRYSYDEQDEIISDLIGPNNTLEAPLPSGQLEQITVTLPLAGNITYFFGIRAWDENGRSVSSDVSNIASASLLFRETPAQDLDLPVTYREPPDYSQPLDVPSGIDNNDGKDGGGEKTTTSAPDDSSEDDVEDDQIDNSNNRNPVIIKEKSDSDHVKKMRIIAITVGLTSCLFIPLWLYYGYWKGKMLKRNLAALEPHPDSSDIGTLDPVYSTIHV